ncbi:class I SAM-dependent methyltransferase [uncultured Roseovarius sp.]|uniref:class I SAM-dependent methyltransferase n=1 Tax=uncultured Roseovarius sp. TaxID=293344 RepID=UPI00262BBD5C|nr:class I SAM-dependent methyltransferase [uncultured Roseovarius sp.]
MTDTNLTAPNHHGAIIRHRHFGLAIPALQWVPAPRYLMRRDVILNLAQGFAPGRLLEIGCGAGALLDDLAGMGFSAVGVDQSPSARRIATSLLVETPAAEIRETCDGLAPESFDHLTAFEVLEHIEDDLAALSDWARYLKPGGALMVSVPAHPERWNPADAWAGHYRRYRRSDLVELVEKAGFEVVKVQCYGFPLANIMERLSARIYDNQTAKRGGNQMKQDERTGASGSDRSLLTSIWPIYSSPPGTLAMRLLWKIQKMFLNGDRGIGYLVLARKT